MGEENGDSLEGKKAFYDALLEAQRAALHVIRDRHPDHRILAEEEDGEGNRV